MQKGHVIGWASLLCTKALGEVPDVEEHSGQLRGLASLCLLSFRVFQK